MNKQFLFLLCLSCSVVIFSGCSRSSTTPVPVTQLEVKVESDSVEPSAQVGEIENEVPQEIQTSPYDTKPSIGGDSK